MVNVLVINANCQDNTNYQLTLNYATNIISRTSQSVLLEISEEGFYISDNRPLLIDNQEQSIIIDCLSGYLYQLKCSAMEYLWRFSRQKLQNQIHQRVESN